MYFDYFDDDDNDTTYCAAYYDYCYNDSNDYNRYGYDDDDDDDSYVSSSSEEDYGFNTNMKIDNMHGNRFKITKNDNVIPYDDDKKLTTIQAAQRQLNSILAGCTTTSSIKEFTNQAKHKHKDFFLPKAAACTVPVTPSSAPTYAKNNDHGVYLSYQWHRSNKNKTKTKPTITPYIATSTYPTAYARSSRMIHLFLPHLRLFLPLTHYMLLLTLK